MGGTAIGTAHTEVAELIFAEEAGHVVAALRPLNLCPASWAKDYCVNALVPAFKGPFHGRLTRGAIPMPVLSAPKADRA